MIKIGELKRGNECILKTKTGDLYVILIGKRLCCNFVGNEMKARAKFGHWKQNALVNSDKEIINHLKSLLN